MYIYFKKSIHPQSFSIPLSRSLCLYASLLRLRMEFTKFDKEYNVAQFEDEDRFVEAVDTFYITKWCMMWLPVSPRAVEST